MSGVVSSMYSSSKDVLIKYILIKYVLNPTYHHLRRKRKSKEKEEN